MSSILLHQQILTSALQEFLKYATPGSLVRGTDLFSLQLSNKKMTAASTAIAVWCECPVLNHKHTGHIIELHLIGQVA